MLILLISALSLGFVHTLLGPDHYVPFVVLAKARNWSIFKTTIITLACGVGHVLSAVVLGAIAVSIGITLSSLNFIESFRGEIAAWLLIGFGFAYFVWGVRVAIRNRMQGHFHSKKGKELTPWVLFIVFVLGPCEPLIPMIMYPAIQKSLLNTILVITVFGLSTLVTMVFMVFAMIYGANKLKSFSLFERYGNAMAGMIICSCGLAIKFLGI